jgi:hypothetical protein
MTLRLPQTDNYLLWARAVQDLIDSQPEIINLFSSAVVTAEDLLLADVHASDAEWREDMAQVGSWGHPAIIRSLAERCGVPESHVFLTSGASNSLVVLAQALVRPGDRVLVEHPHYQPFVYVLQQAGAAIIDLPRTPGGVDSEALERGLRRGARAVVLSNLHNPTAMHLTADRLGAIAEMAAQQDALVIVDEIFHDFIDEPSAATLGAHVIALGSLSKVYGLSALRCGWILAAPPLHERLRPALILYENTVSRLAQAASARAFAHLDVYRQRARDRCRANRAWVEAFAAPLLAQGVIEGRVPSQGCVYFPRLLSQPETQTFAQALAAATGVIVVPGAFFGAPAHIRIGYGGDTARLQAGLARLSEHLMQPRG